MTVQLAFCIDENFAPYLAACLHSLKTFSTLPCEVHVVGLLCQDTQSKLQSLADEKLGIQFIDKVPDYSSFAVSGRYASRLNQITYWRMALAELLPHLSKVLFLDADVLITADIKELWGVDVSNVYAAVVSDHSLVAQQHWKKLAIDSGNYFNAGMMLLNLEYWRVRNAKDALAATFHSRHEWDYNDQDVLNVVMANEVKYLDASFNTQTYTLAKHLVSRPVVVHFTGQEKPWHASSAHPYTSQFRSHLNSTPYSDHPCQLFLDSVDVDILNQLQVTLPDGGMLAVWGAGMRGRRLVLAINKLQKNYQVKLLLDSNLKGEWAGLCINQPAEADFSQIDVLLIASVPARADIVKRLGNVNFCVI